MPNVFEEIVYMIFLNRLSFLLYLEQKENIQKTLIKIKKVS